MTAKTRSFADLGGGKRVFVSLVLPASAEDEETDGKLRLMSEAAPRGLSIKDWENEGAGGWGATRGRSGGRPHAEISAPPKSVNEVNFEKDKPRLDAFSAALVVALADNA